MRYPLHRCPLLTQTTKAIDTFVTQLQHSPGGYVWWFGLPKRGWYSGKVLKRKWVTTVLDVLMPPVLQRAMLLACFEPSGQPVPSAKPLRNWLLVNVYNGDATKMMTAWYNVH
jgi:hypothetical protein